MTGERKWTPGRWLLAAKPSSVVGWPIVASPQGRSIGHITYGPQGENFAEFNAESEANGHLIAAAPALYEALETLCNADDAVHTALAGEPADTINELHAAQAAMSDAVKQGRAALAKARGETP